VRFVSRLRSVSNVSRLSSVSRVRSVSSVSRWVASWIYMDIVYK
jgi:hypothetical protein